MLFKLIHVEPCTGFCFFWLLNNIPDIWFLTRTKWTFPVNDTASGFYLQESFSTTSKSIQDCPLLWGTFLSVWWDRKSGSPSLWITCALDDKVSQRSDGLNSCSLSCAVVFSAWNLLQREVISWGLRFLCLLEQHWRETQYLRNTREWWEGRVKQGLQLTFLWATAAVGPRACILAALTSWVQPPVFNGSLKGTLSSEKQEICSMRTHWEEAQKDPVAHSEVISAVLMSGLDSTRRQEA